MILNYGIYGVFRIMSKAGFISSTVPPVVELQSSISHWLPSLLEAVVAASVF